jgi:hypothetical protein
MPLPELEAIRRILRAPRHPRTALAQRRPFKGARGEPAVIDREVSWLKARHCSLVGFR